MHLHGAFCSRLPLVGVRDRQTDRQKESFLPDLHTPSPHTGTWTSKAMLFLFVPCARRKKSFPDGTPDPPDRDLAIIKYNLDLQIGTKPHVLDGQNEAKAFVVQHSRCEGGWRRMQKRCHFWASGSSGGWVPCCWCDEEVVPEE